MTLGGSRPDLLVREAQGPAEWEAVRELCCLTGNGGEPIARERWPFFAEQWVGPYQRLLPEWTWVAFAAGDRRVTGYLTCAPDTRTFRVRKAFAHTFLLLIRIAFRFLARDVDTRRFVRRALWIDPTPERRFPREVRSRIEREYPAHLHMNVLAASRGSGAGRELVARCVARLREVGVGGIHLYCGDGPVGFYSKTGFRVLHTIQLPGGARVHAMGRLTS